MVMSVCVCVNRFFFFSFPFFLTGTTAGAM